MSDFADLLIASHNDPSVLTDRARLAAFHVTNADLAALRKLDPVVILRVVQALEERLRTSEHCVACTSGAQACTGRPVE